MPDRAVSPEPGHLKQKLFGAIAVIAAVNVLEWFMDIERQVDNTKLAWVVGILLAFACPCSFLRSQIG